MKLTPHGKLCIGLIFVGIVSVFIFGFIAGVSVEVERKRDDIAGHNSVTVFEAKRSNEL